MKNGAGPSFPGWVELALRDLAEMAQELEDSSITAAPSLAGYYRVLSTRLWLIHLHLTRGEWDYPNSEWEN